MDRNSLRKIILAIARLWLKVLAYQVDCMVKYKTQDKKPWDESKHHRRANGQFGTGSIEESFDIPRTLNAMAKKFRVKVEKPLRDKGFSLKEGTTVTKVRVIASGKKIRDVGFLINNNPLPNGKKTKVSDWNKCRGTADVTDGKSTYKNCEVHWYQCDNIGKIDFKVKVWGEKQ